LTVRISFFLCEKIVSTVPFLFVTVVVHIPVLWIFIGFIADPGPTFYLNADTDLDPGAKPMQIRGQTF
jgi:hypothetical protein